MVDVEAHAERCQMANMTVSILCIDSTYREPPEKRDSGVTPAEKSRMATIYTHQRVGGERREGGRGGEGEGEGEAGLQDLGGDQEEPVLREEPTRAGGEPSSLG